MRLPIQLLLTLTLGCACAQDVYLAAHDVGDLLGQPGAPLELGVDSLTPEVLEQLVRDQFGDELSRHSMAQLAVGHGTLLLVHTATVHDAVRSFLADLRQRSGTLVPFEVTLATVPPQVIADVQGAGALTRTIPDERPTFALTAELEERLLSVIREGDGQLIDRLRLETQLGVTTSIRRGMEESYVQDLEILAGGGITLSDPQMAQVEHGLELSLVPRSTAADVRAFDLELRCVTLEGLQEIKTSVGSLQLPAVLTQTSSHKVELVDGLSLLLAGLQSPLPLEPGGRKHQPHEDVLIALVRPLAPIVPAAGVEPVAFAEDRRVPSQLGGDPSLRVYDVRDLIMSATDFAAPELGLDDAPGDAGQPDVAPEESAAELAEWLRANLLPAIWRDGSFSLTHRSGQLLVRGTPDVHRLLELLLEDLRRANSILVNLEARILQVSDAARVRELEALVGTEITDRTAILEQIAAEDSGVEVLSAPVLMTYSGQRANVSIVNQVAYISDFDIEVQRLEDGAEVMLGDPIIDVIQEGLSFEVCARASADRETIQVELSLHRANLVRPIPARAVRISTVDAEVQTPCIAVQHLEGRLRLRDGSSSLFSTPAAGDDRTFVLFTVQLVTGR